LTENTAIANRASRCNIPGNARSQRLCNFIDTKASASVSLKKDSGWVQRDSVPLASLAKKSANLWHSYGLYWHFHGLYYSFNGLDWYFRGFYNIAS